MKKALLVISFGTSYHETCTKNIVACEEQLSRTFADRDRFRAFTSGMIIRKLKKRDNLDLDTPAQALLRLAELGYQDVAVQSRHVINGDEYEVPLPVLVSPDVLIMAVELPIPLISGFTRPS